ncbi:MAG: sn-glycerol-3-phosphate ABC transporter ATP-binding protein UgpC [Roseovarius sp.]|nr:sn-glycerol-3-phosphate ABC transporter ATP-binding protein UgpC [Roseovarius sp.]
MNNKQENMQIEFVDVDKFYGAFHALKSINLSIPKGHFVALVGPSGCGKSTLLRSLAGLEDISSGKINVGGQTVNDMPPRKRDLAMVFQSYALYPHMNVRDNLTYALRLKKVSKAERAKKADEVASVIGLEDLLDRKPKELSGGQRQRVAMGRAIIREPQAFLFDEPLSNLDASLRVRMRKEIRALHERIGSTSVYVTHDQVEAMTMADHVVVMRAGVIEQQGPPLELYEKPANCFVGGFIGSPAMNFVPATVDADGNSVTLKLDSSPSVPIAKKLQGGRSVLAGLRPEHLELCAKNTKGSIPITLSAVEATGSITFLFTSDTPEMVIVADGNQIANDGDRLGMKITPENVHLFDPETELAIGET